MLLLSADDDTVVKASECAWFVEKLQPQYGDKLERLRHVSYANANHVLDAATWRLAYAHSIAFLRRFVASSLQQ
jgi:hypothetical protein